VASELEARWNGALARVAEAEGRLAAAGKATEPLSEPLKQQLTALSEDLMALWKVSLRSSGSKRLRPMQVGWEG
jgi:hypothetical protein